MIDGRLEDGRGRICCAKLKKTFLWWSVIFVWIIDYLITVGMWYSKIVLSFKIQQLALRLNRHTPDSVCLLSAPSYIKIDHMLRSPALPFLYFSTTPPHDALNSSCKHCYVSVVLWSHWYRPIELTVFWLCEISDHPQLMALYDYYQHLLQHLTAWPVWKLHPTRTTSW